MSTVRPPLHYTVARWSLLALVALVVVALGWRVADPVVLAWFVRTLR